MLIHQLSTGFSGKYNELKDDFTNSTVQMKHLYKLYLKYTTMDLKTVIRVLKKDIWWNAAKCIKNGLVDEIYKGLKINLTIDKELDNKQFSTAKLSNSRKRQRTEDVVLDNLDSSDDSDDLEDSDESDNSDDSDDSDDSDLDDLDNSDLDELDTKLFKFVKTKPAKSVKPTKPAKSVKSTPAK